MTARACAVRPEPSDSVQVRLACCTALPHILTRLALPITVCNALLKDCLVELQPDGSPTEETKLERWPRFAPPPTHLRFWGSDKGCTDLAPFLQSCMKQSEQYRRRLRDVRTLEMNDYVSES